MGQPETCGRFGSSTTGASNAVPFNPPNKIRVGRIDGKDIYMVKHLAVVFAVQVDAPEDWDVYDLHIMRHRKTTSDFVDALWAMLAMRGYV